jgi:hypothetical protein
MIRRIVCAAVPLLAALAAGCGDPPQPQTSAAPAARPADAPKPPPADPMKDAAAWRALPAGDRAARAALLVEKTDAASAPEVERTHDFLVERAESAAVGALAKKVLAAGGIAPWAHEAAGDVNLAPEVDACLKSAEAAEDADDLGFVRLRAMRSKVGGTWWADATGAAKVRALCAGVKATEARLQTPYGQGVEKWARFQRAIEVMKDSPALHGARGPYVVFVSLNSAKGGKLADVAADEIARGAKILEKNLALFEQYYDGWMTTLGPVFGFTRYGADNCDDRTLFKVNVFSNAAEYRLYNDKTGSGMGGFARAYYSPQEPRFITTYDGGENEDAAATDQTQCHEATHQLVHFYTWDLSRKALKREVSWDDCEVRPMWCEEGFAEFFSSFAVKDGRYAWMQPLDERMCHLWLLGEIAAAKSWRPWELKEFLSMRDAGQMDEASQLRAGLKSEDRGLASSVMGNLYYAKAWSLVYFLWYAEENGKPRYRDRFTEYLKFQFLLRYRFDKVEKKEVTVPVGSNDFRRIIGVEKDDQLAAIEKEWQAYERKLVEAHRKPAWAEQRAKARKALKLDK